LQVHLTIDILLLDIRQDQPEMKSKRSTFWLKGWRMRTIHLMDGK